MIQRFLARFGYIKVPREAIELSKEQEKFLRRVRNTYKNTGSSGEKLFNYYLKGQEVLTQFLESGRIDL